MDSTASELEALKRQLAKVERDVTDFNVRAQMIRDRIVELQSPDQVL